jgi:hypothetical protein
MVKLVNLKKKKQNYIYIYIKFLTNIKKKKRITNYLDEELIGSSFALPLCFVLVIFSVRVAEKKEREVVKEGKKSKKLIWPFT